MSHEKIEIAGPSGGGWREVVGESLFSVILHVGLRLLLTVPHSAQYTVHSTCRVYSLFIDQCVAVLHTCVGTCNT